MRVMRCLAVVFQKNGSTSVDGTSDQLHLGSRSKACSQADVRAAKVLDDQTRRSSVLEESKKNDCVEHGL
jgi:hypothetical protein